MQRAVHPELAKRIVTTDAERGPSRFDHMGAMQLVQGTRAGAGKDIPKEQQLKEVTILDVYQSAASVKIVVAAIAAFAGDHRRTHIHPMGRRGRSRDR